MWLDSLFGKERGDDSGKAKSGGDPKFRRGANGLLEPDNGDEELDDIVEAKKKPSAKRKQASDPPAPSSSKTPPDTSALNQQVVQAVQFSNFETADYAPELVTTPPELMVGTTTGIAVQDAASYMNGIMQIALAAQAVAIKKAAEGPVEALEEIPLLAEIQKMVDAAVTVYGDVSTTAGESAKTVIGDLKSG